MTNITSAVVPAYPGFTREVTDARTGKIELRHVVAWAVKILPKDDPRKVGPDPVELQAIYAPTAYTYDDYQG